MTQENYAPDPTKLKQLDSNVTEDTIYYYKANLTSANYIINYLDTNPIVNSEEFYTVLIKNAYIVTDIVRDIGQVKAAQLFGISQAQLSTIVKMLSASLLSRPLADVPINSLVHCWQDYKKEIINRVTQCNSHS